MDNVLTPHTKSVISHLGDSIGSVVTFPLKHGQRLAAADSCDSRVDKLALPQILVHIGKKLAKLHRDLKVCPQRLEGM